MPTSAPWRLSVVGSWMVKKTCSRSRKPISCRVKQHLHHLGMPGAPRTQPFDNWGSGRFFHPHSPKQHLPRLLSGRKTASRHQKQPPARVARSFPSSTSDIGYTSHFIMFTSRLMDVLYLLNGYLGCEITSRSAISPRSAEPAQQWTPICGGLTTSSSIDRITSKGG